MEACKATNSVTSEQLTWLEAFRAAGIMAVVWRPEQWDEIERILA